MLKLIKIIHTAIWVIMVSAIFYIIYAGWNQIYDWRWWWASGLILVEIGVLVINKFTCPLTQWARKYDVAIDDNFDIYLPNWLARHNKVIFGCLLCLGIILHIMR